MMKVFVYPTEGKGSVLLNPYINNLKEVLAKHYELIEPLYKLKLPMILIFFLNSFKANIYVLNWIENSAAGKSGFWGAILSLLGLQIIKLRGGEVVWIFHNIHPHEGETYWTLKLKKYLFRNATMIIAHSKEAYNYAKQYASCSVCLKNHPIKKEDYGFWDGKTVECDFFYWGTILPYKGIVEFLSNPLCRETKRKILIMGKCKEDSLFLKIQSLLTDNVRFENRSADFCEIAAQCKKSKYVIFPYIGNSISSSGILMDTLQMGGVPVGPNRGAFADLAERGCCITYNNIDEVFLLPVDKKNCKILDKNQVKAFVDENSWESFGTWFHTTI